MASVARRQYTYSSLLRRVLLCCTCLPASSWPRLRTGIAARCSSAHLAFAQPLAFVCRIPGSCQPQRSSTSQADLSGQRPQANRKAKALARLQRDMVSKNHFERQDGSTRARAVSPEMAHDKAAEAQQPAAPRSGDSAAAQPAPRGLGHRWLLLRHGQTNYNADGRVQGSSDKSRLSDEGRRQAQAVGRFLGQLQIDSVYVSPLARAQETLEQAEDVAGKPFAERKVVIDDLREVDLHEWEGLYKEKIKETWPDIYKQWRGGNPAGFRLESGKYPIRDLWKRASGVWKQLFTEASGRDGAEQHLGEKTSLLTGHNGVNQALFATAFGLSEEAFRQYEFPNCGVMELVWNPGEDMAREWRWIYPSRTGWKTVEETKFDLSNATSSASGEKGEMESAESADSSGSSPVSV